ncbi:hypothetical protein FHT78_001684 [Rhizobium sp. BK196]|jgi:hypothetical protein|nr:hypothetical protein [Rhizobium sp. BK196]MBB3462689.1 hypothetical protein [Rhizobium sp. BK377]
MTNKQSEANKRHSEGLVTQRSCSSHQISRTVRIFLLFVESRSSNATNIDNTMENLMRYLCLFYIDQTLADAASKEEWAEIDRESLASNEELKRSGHYLASNALADPKTAKTLRVRAGKTSWSDGPFAETKEHLGGFLLIEAKDLAEAMEIAERDSLARMGAIEIRETAGF